MDIDCGAIARRRGDVEQMGQRIFDLVLEIASGQQHQERGSSGFGDHEFTPWQIGAVM